MISVCMECRSWTERNTKKRVCECGAGFLFQRLFNDVDDFLFFELENNPDEHLLYLMKVNNIDGRRNSMIVKLKHKLEGA